MPAYRSHGHWTLRPAVGSPFSDRAESDSSCHTSADVKLSVLSARRASLGVTNDVTDDVTDDTWRFQEERICGRRTMNSTTATAVVVGRFQNFLRRGWSASVKSATDIKFSSSNGLFRDF